MNAKQISAFRAVMISGSMVGAAKMLYISQPAVTRLIKDLEETCGFALFERRSSRLFPTPEAEALYLEVKRHFMGLDQLSQSVDQIKTLRTGRLRIAAMPALAYSILPRVVSGFLRQHEEVSLTLNPCTSIEAAKLIGSQQFDLGIVMLPVDTREISFYRCYRTACKLICRNDHRFSAQSSVDATELNNEPFVTIGEQNPLTRYRIDAAFQANNIKPNQLVETPMFNTAQALVSEGLGVSIVDPYTAHMFTEQGGISRDFNADIPFYFGFIYPINKQISTLAEEFINSFEIQTANITSTEQISPEDIDLK
ncbi:LysR family transcriptional regulator [Amphritea balenae]|uniref:LysR family transcriptional regulator n=1 Tax=Amphritea balenae TaxID=452629 RepID=A0A3P1SP20_9GAMM|nr:LysR family transcriptional regulator [Amphritea balenae]RRC98883.1 LysR family transcriptional regulator [Amphritea balenae]GGK62531.1 transcriptional regulator [Amphritea balenae]